MEEADGGIEYEQYADNGRLHVFVKYQLQHDGGFEQAWHRCHEFAEKNPPSRRLDVDARIRAVVFQTSCSFGNGEAKRSTRCSAGVGTIAEFY